MTTIQKAFIVVILTVTMGTGVYEAHSYSKLRDQLQALQQQPPLLAEQLRQWQREHDDATNRLASLLAENKQLKAGRNLTELLQLRGEVTQLMAAGTHSENDTTASAAKSWLNRVEQLKQYVEQHPNEKIPEFQFLTDKAWLHVADAGLETEDFETTNDYWHAMQSLRFKAQDRFGTFIQTALQKYSDANNGQFPTDLSQLQPYCDPDVEAVLQQLYAIKPVSILPANQIKEMNLKTDWVVTRKKRVVFNSTSRAAYFADGNAWWQSPPGSDDQ